MSIRVYWIDARAVDPDSSSTRALMSERRREKLARLPLAGERRRSAAAELALALAMARERGGQPGPVPWAVQRGGKPYLPGSQLHFSLSHAADAAVCAVADQPVGVDVERSRPIARGLRRKLLSPAEIDCSDGALLWKWVAKESYLKLTGEGLARPMTGFSAREGRIADEAGRALACVRTAEFPWPDYTLCVATERQEPLELIALRVPDSGAFHDSLKCGLGASPAMEAPVFRISDSEE